MIKTQQVEYSDEILEEVMMQALESQFRATIPCMNTKEYELHKRTEILLADIYKRINSRKIIKNGRETIQRGGYGYENFAKRIF